MSDSNNPEKQMSIPLIVSIPAIIALFLGGGAMIWHIQSGSTAKVDIDDKRPSRISRTEEDFLITEPTPIGHRKFLPLCKDVRPEVNGHSMRRVEEKTKKLLITVDTSRPFTDIR